MFYLEGTHGGQLCVDGIATYVRFPNGTLSGSFRTKDLVFALGNERGFPLGDVEISFPGSGKFRLVKGNTHISLIIEETLEDLKQILKEKTP